jgi:hypothetical protein
VEEYGSVDFSPFAAGGETDEIFVIAQLPEERPEQFAERVLGRLAALAHAGHGVVQATWILSRSADRESLCARARVGQALVSVLSKSGPGRLTVTAGNLSATSRDQILSVVGEMVARREAAGVPIRLRLGRRRAAEVLELRDRPGLAGSGRQGTEKTWN